MIRVRTWQGMRLIHTKVIRGGGLESLRQHLEMIGMRPTEWIRVGTTIFVDVQLGKNGICKNGR